MSQANQKITGAVTFPGVENMHLDRPIFKGPFSAPVLDDDNHVTHDGVTYEVEYLNWPEPDCTCPVELRPVLS